MSPEDATAPAAPLRVGETLPAVLTLEAFAALVLGVGRARAYDLQRLGDLTPFELQPRIGNKARYSGKKIQAWLDGESEPRLVLASTRRAK